MNNPLKRKRSSGGGRKPSTLSGGGCKQKYPCAVCRKDFRKDHLKAHYESKVLFTKGGAPAPPFSDVYMKCNSEDKKKHTRYFYEKGFTKQKIPPMTVIAGAFANPFLAAKASSQSQSKTSKEAGERLKRQDSANSSTNEEQNTSEHEEGGEGDSFDKENDSSSHEEVEEPSIKVGTFQLEEDLVPDLEGSYNSSDLVPDLEGSYNSSDLVPDLEGSYNSSIAKEIIEDRISQHDFSHYITSSDEEAEKERVEIEEPRKETVSKEAETNQDKEVLEELSQLRLSDENCNKIATQVANLIFEKQRLKEEEEEETSFKKMVNDLTETEKNYMCMPCITYGHTEKIPKSLRGTARGNYGVFHKLDSTRKVNKTRRESIKSHFKNPLHELCVKLKNENKIQAEENHKKNVEACTKVVSNAVYCLKYSMSSADFVRLNDKDNLTSSGTCATVNDGPQEFFAYRDKVYKLLSQKIKAAFKEVKSCSFTLDKVTVQSKPYTVLVTYYFNRGEINVLLNNLHVMKSTEYDGEGTANFVGMELVRTLGITREQVSSIFHHAIYDGVYATPEERAHGGGCLSLTQHLADWCDVDVEHFTGNWDMGHKLQLVYGDVFLQNKEIIALNKTIFGIMGDFTSGQVALKFKELKEELNHATVGNQRNQETRWARAQLKAYQSYFRNMPTLYVYFGREEKACADALNITEQKAMKKKVEELSDGKTIALAVGVCQLLDSYAAASLSSQHLRFFPTSVIKEVTTLQDKLTTWKEKWIWEDSDLYHTTIGPPAQIINKLKEGTYSPNITDGVKRSALARMKVKTNQDAQLKSELQHDWANMKDTITLIDPKDHAQVVIGEIPILDFNSTDEEEVKSSLQELCAELETALRTRLKTPPLFSALGEAFNSPESWYNTDEFMEPDQLDVVEQKIANILTHVKGKSGTAFASHVKEIGIGYNLFLYHYVTTLSLGEGDGVLESVKIPMETVYKQFWNLHHEEVELSYFIEFFEFVMVKSYSEAICESIGSIMNMACGTGRVLYPDNYAKEIFIRFNLPPMHILNERFIPELVNNELVEKRFFRKGDLTQRQQRKLKYASTSATIGNFRVREDEKFFGLKC